MNHSFIEVDNNGIHLLKIVVSLTLEESEYSVTEGELSTRVCAGFSESDIIERSLSAVLRTLPSGSASGIY